jgi:hypothetical protein
LAEALVEAGQFQQAQETARYITDPGHQARALAAVAEALARAGDIRASRIVAAICRLGHWTTALPAALLLEPNAFTALAPMLEG